MSVNQITTMSVDPVESGKNTGKNTFITLCIPRVFSNISEKRIRHIFYKLRLGFISKIDMVMSKTPKAEKIYKVFIHFKYFFENSNAQHALNTLKSGKEIKIIYDDPWFWKVYEYKKNKLSNPAKSIPAAKTSKQPVINSDSVSEQTQLCCSSDNFTSTSSDSTIPIHIPEQYVERECIQINCEENFTPYLIDYGKIQWSKKKRLSLNHNAFPKADLELEEGEIIE